MKKTIKNIIKKFFYEYDNMHPDIKDAYIGFPIFGGIIGTIAGGVYAITNNFSLLKGINHAIQTGMVVYVGINFLMWGFFMLIAILELIGQKIRQWANSP